MTTKYDDEAKVAHKAEGEVSPSPPVYAEGSVQDDNTYVYDDSQKLGYTATVFVILNKMIGTGSMCAPLRYMTTCLRESQSFRHLPASSLLPVPLVYRSSSGSSAAS